MGRLIKCVAQSKGFKYQLDIIVLRNGHYFVVSVCVDNCWELINARGCECTTGKRWFDKLNE